MPFSVRLDASTERLLDRMARAARSSKADVIRHALEQLGRLPDNSSAVRPLEAVAHLIGSVNSGDGSLSESTGAGFRRLLSEKRVVVRGSIRRRPLPT